MGVVGDGCDELVISPELVLVCPELRQRPIVQLPDRDPDGFFPLRPPVLPPDVRARLTLVAAASASHQRSSAPIPTRTRSVTVAATAYLVKSVAEAAVGAATTDVVALAELIRG